mmetsp:Transcript_74069/g.176384  ORF Transcript_74069/g.176384 Transcript_74069/m.176384 type:complete len:730 (-) Transcript_74069:9-2198(-)
MTGLDQDSVADSGSEMLAVDVPEVWSSDEEEDLGEQCEHCPEKINLAVVQATLDRLQSIPGHNTRERSLSEPSSPGAVALSQFGSGALPPRDDQLCDRLAYQDVTGSNAESFQTKYIAGTGRPCLVTGVPEAEQWPALEKWQDTSTFVRHYGSTPVQVTEMGSSLGGKAMRLELPISCFTDYAATNDADWPYYSWERQWDGPRAPLLADFCTPLPFRDDLYDLNDETRSFLPLSCHLFVLIGGPRSGSNIHKDPKWTGAWNTVMCGQKRWVLFPPHVSSADIGAGAGDYKSSGPPAYWWLDHYPRLREEGGLRGMVDVIQEPGDTIFIPNGWWHAVLNLPPENGVTICCTRNCLLPASLAWAWPSMHKGNPCFARRFARHIRRMRPDAAVFLPPESEEALVERPSRIGTDGWDIIRCHCSELSLKQVREDFIHRGRPLIILGLSQDLLSPECCDLSREWLRGEMGMKVVAVRKSFARDSREDVELLTIDEFCHRLDCGEKLYLYDLSLPLQLPTLLDHVRIPRYFAHCRLQRTRLRHCFDRSWPTLFIGAKGTHSRLHVDQWHGHFWMTVASGSKNWSIWHPEDTHLLSPSFPGKGVHPTFPDLDELEHSPGFASARRIDFTLHEGETLFVPGGSPHFVVNAEDSTAFAGNFLDESNCEAATADLRAMAAGEAEENPISQVLAALDEVDWPDDDDPPPDRLQSKDLVVPYAAFRGGIANSWPAVPSALM